MKTLTEKTLILAHRGASGYAPENTMEAFELAAKMGADGIELDVHLTADGEVVVCHDEKIDRTSNGQGLITDYTLAELKAFDFGYHFYEGEGKGFKIPTLDEVYGLMSSCGMLVNVEIKSADPEIIRACDAVAERTLSEVRPVLYLEVSTLRGLYQDSHSCQPLLVLLKLLKL